MTTTLVVGGTGKTGRRVAERLRERGMAVRIGSRLLSFADAAGEISAAAGREVRYVPVSPAEFAAAAAGQGVPEAEVDVLTELFARVLDGRNSSVTRDVERVLDRPATDFADFARNAAATGVWAR